MQLEVKTMSQSVITIALDGRLDVFGAGEIDAPFSAVAAANKGVIVDLSRVSFLASIGVRVLLNAAKVVRRRGGRLVLVHPVPDVERVLEVTGVGELMPVYHDSASAFAAVTQ
jgi:anti-sigma B factor antagonist